MERRLLLVAILVGVWLAPAAHATGGRWRILYASDWNGPTQIFAADPSGRAPLGQVTFGRPEPCGWAAACGFTGPLPSPDGRWLAYFAGAAAFNNATLWLARADGSGARAVGAASGAAWAPDSGRLAYAAADGIHVLTVAGGDRIVDRRSGGALCFSPDGRAIAFIGGGGGLFLLRGGHERRLVRDALWSPVWSPDGRRIAYGTWRGIVFLDLASGRARLVYRVQAGDLIHPAIQLGRIELAWSPDGRRLAFMLGDVRVLDTQTLRARRLTRDGGLDLAWSPDGRSLLYVQGGEDSNGDSISTGDVRTVTLAGRVRTVVSGSKPYGGQITSAAWTRQAPGVRYRAAQQVDGVFVGGPVQELVADGARVAFVACKGVSVWTPSSGALVAVERAAPGDCPAWFSRGHVFSLGLAGDRVVWWEKGWGLCFQYGIREAALGAAPIVLGTGSGCLGGSAGSGTAVGAGALLVLSRWTFHYDSGAMVVDEQAIERVEPGGCPCPVLSSSPGPYTPLDVDAGRIVASGENETRILGSDGAILLSLPLPTLAAQLSGSDLVLAAGRQLRVYDAATGVQRSAWPLPAPASHDCDLYGDPSCQHPPPLTLEDVGRGLAVYVLDSQVHLLRLADGTDTAVAEGAHARFTDAGLVYADGARIRLLPWERLPLR